MGIDFGYGGGGETGCLAWKVFGDYFGNVEGCLNMMREHRVIASGSAVLRACLGECSWEPGDLDLYSGHGDYDESFNWVLPWIDFFFGEGYEIQMKDCGILYRRVEVSVVCHVVWE